MVLLFVKPLVCTFFSPNHSKIKSVTENENVSVPRKYKMAHLDFLRYLFKKVRVNFLRRARTFIQALLGCSP